MTDESDQPFRRGAVLARRDEREGTAVLMVIVKRLRDIDRDEFHYEISDPTLTGYRTYRAEDLTDCFEDTGLTWDRADTMKPIVDAEIRERYQELHDEVDEHSFQMFHTRDEDGELQPTGKQCIHCGKRRDEA